MYLLSATDPSRYDPRIKKPQRFDQLRSVQSERFADLIDAGLKSEVHRSLNQKPWIEDHATLDDIIKANRYLMYLGESPEEMTLLREKIPMLLGDR